MVTFCENQKVPVAPSTVENRRVVITFYHFWEKGKKQFF